jgi:CHAT domain-containing protein/tetratricopeptide (TPR) repeat protein
MKVGLRRRRTGVVVALVLGIASVLPPATAQQSDLSAILKRSQELLSARNLPAALLEAQKLEALMKARVGVNHANYALTLNNLATVYREQGKYDEAERLYHRAFTIFEKASGRDHPNVAGTLNNLAIVHEAQGKYGEAEGLYQRALAIFERALGGNHSNVAMTLNNLAILYRKQSKYGEAVGLYQRTLAIREKALGRGHPNVASSLNDLAGLYQLQGKYDEAERLYQRALAINENALGPDHSAVANVLNNLAAVYSKQGKYSEAERLYQRALAIKENALGRDHPHLATILNNLGSAYQKQGKYGEAEGFYERALVVYEKALGRDHSDVADVLNNLGTLSLSQAKYSDAEKFYQRALAIKERVHARDHPDVLLILDNLAILNAGAGNSKHALTLSRRVTGAIVAHAAAEAPSIPLEENAAGFVEQRALYFRRHLANLAAVTRTGDEPEASLGREGLEIAQWASHSSAAAAMQQMAARFASGSSALAGVVREKQDLAVVWRDRDKRLLDALSKPEGQQNRAATEALRKEIGDIEARSAAIAARLEREFPDYAALASPKPLKAEEVQRLLGADEALMFWLAGDKESYVFAVTRDGFGWRTIPLGAEALSQKVAGFRRGLDVDEVRNSVTAGQPVLFDLGLAHELYAGLFGPIEALIRDKRNLLVVATGPLTSLPFHLLVTEEPAVAVPEVKDIAAYRDAAWLMKRHAVTVLPSVASLKALRVFASKAPGAKPMVGFGDPVFRPEQLVDASRMSSSKIAVRTRAYADFWQGKGVDRAKLSEALPALPDTAKELKAVAKELGAPASDIHLGRDASETTVKRTPLAGYRIVYFATHGLVAGDVKGLGEPALVLSLPKVPSEFDDGLLTASEVAQLKLAADWVVLSACNTAAGDKPGAEALSGLARAFFYAGARALLVSHWNVETDAATRLTTSTFRIMKADAKAGRAEGLRRAMLEYMNDGSNPWNVYPAYWGPFAVVGEGAAK